MFPYSSGSVNILYQYYSSSIWIGGKLFDSTGKLSCLDVPTILEGGSEGLSSVQALLLMLRFGGAHGTTLLCISPSNFYRWRKPWKHTEETQAKALALAEEWARKNCISSHDLSRPRRRYKHVPNIYIVHWLHFYFYLTLNHL